MQIKDFVERGVNCLNDMGEIRVTRNSSILFSNGWVASILKRDDVNFDLQDEYSVAVCDYNGYFNYELLENLDGFSHGAVLCDSEEKVCAVLEVIENFEKIMDDWRIRK